DAVETGGIVRYYDNNNFYRDPIVRGDLTPDDDMAADLDAAASVAQLDGATLQAVIPGPYSLFDLATDEHYGDDREFLSALADFLAAEVADLPEPVETAFVLEPSLVTTPPSAGLDEAASDAIDTVVGALDADVVVHTYWGALEERVHAHLLDADLDAIGYDFVSAHEANRSLIAEYGTADDIAMGVVDGQNTLVETPETVLERVEWVVENTPPAQDFGTVYLSPNTELFYLPVNRFEEKLETLAAAAEMEVDT
ncbi:MAG: 5-methyltetrahydropteroyltriglutamate--homocysteine methyltransferase, partial [Halodesulfurarchaeum sp.]